MSDTWSDPGGRVVLEGEANLAAGATPKGWTQAGNPATVNAHDGGMIETKELRSRSGFPAFTHGGVVIEDDGVTNGLILEFVNYLGNPWGITEAALIDLAATGGFGPRVVWYYDGESEGEPYSGTLMLLTDLSSGTHPTGKLNIFGANGSNPGAGQAAAIPNAAGGATIDTEARAALNALLAAMRAWGFVAA